MKTYDDTYKIKTKMKNNNNNKNNYTCIFHCPITINDCINSIDLKEDKVIFGTLMGDAYLCRIDQDLNLFKKPKNNYNDKILIPPLNFANLIEKDNINLIKFPKITQIINRSRENIPCVEFETNDIINICIGDLEIIHLEKMSTFNKNDKNSTYNFSKLRNYKTENEHIIYCETALCFLKHSCFLILYTKLAEFEDIYENAEINYENKNLKSGEIIKGTINLSNFVIPFDFDGDMFLYIDFISKKEKFIGVEFTRSKKEKYIYNIKDIKNFGHISHMKIITYEKIFLVRNEVQCEIRYLNNDFEILEKFEYIGYDILSCCLFYVDNLEYSIDLLVDDESEKNIEEKLNQSNGGKIEQNVLKLFENRNNLVENNKEKTTMINTNQTINKKKKSRAAKNNKYIFNQNLLISNNFEENKIISSIENIKKIKLMNSSSNIMNKSIDKSTTKKEIYKRINYHTIDDYQKKIRYNIISSDKKNSEKKNNSFSSIEIFEKKNKNIKNKNKEKEDKTVMLHNKTNNEYKIIFLDKNGSVYLYQNNSQINLFNIYAINNIKQKYKNISFFSLGFPYHIIANDYYFCITTDFGLFVFSKIDE